MNLKLAVRTRPEPEREDRDKDQKQQIRGQTELGQQERELDQLEPDQDLHARELKPLEAEQEPGHQNPKPDLKEKRKIDDIQKRSRISSDFFFCVLL